MDQLELFETGELITIREYLQGWNAATRERVLQKKAKETSRAEKVGHAALSHSQSVERK